MHNSFFITGIGTDVGKTLVSAILTEALGACYWKPVQAGREPGTDAGFIASMIDHPEERIFPETYQLALAASPHISARAEQVRIDTDRIRQDCERIQASIPATPLIIEGAGGLLVPLNEQDTVADLIVKLPAKVILVSRNYLGSINHSLLSAAYCRQRGMEVAGWIFCDQYMDYEQEIVQWTGYPLLGSIPLLHQLTPEIVQQEAKRMAPGLQQMLVS